MLADTIRANTLVVKDSQIAAVVVVIVVWSAWMWWQSRKEDQRSQIRHDERQVSLDKGLENIKLLGDVATLESLVEDLRSDEPCRVDHDGNCQTHNWFDEAMCPHARSKLYFERRTVHTTPDAPKAPPDPEGPRGA